MPLRALPSVSSARAGQPALPNPGQGRIRERVPVAVIDIGSNSVRQVIYEGLSRAPAVLFNEKILCGLGKGLLTSGMLNPEGVDRALAAVRRFVALGRQTGVAETYILATAAARDASNGPEFIERVEEITGRKVEVLTGAMEAHYSALGIKSGFHRPAGIVGDMGGGSVELVTVNGGVGEGITLPLGGLWLQESSKNSLDAARRIARHALDRANFAWPAGKRTFYAVGGTWRSLGKLHIASSHYPLQALHDYEVTAPRMMDFCDRILTRDLSELRGIDAVSKNRRDLLPYGAVVLREIILHFKPELVAISSLGVREGFLYSKLSPEEQEQDSLLSAARDLSILRARSPEHSFEMAEWTGRAFAELGITESENEARYRIASCYLADLGWRAHPDFRAKQAQEVIANAGFVGIDHEGRAYLAIANFHRYQGLGPKIEPPPVAELASPEMRRKARILGAMFRVLYLFSASMPGVIPRLKLTRTGEKHAVLTVPAEIADLTGERPAERIRQFGKELGIDVALEIV